MRGPVGPDLRASRSNKVDLPPKAAISVSARRADLRADPTRPCRQFCQFQIFRPFRAVRCYCAYSQG